jgi:hypothetical protein
MRRGILLLLFAALLSVLPLAAQQSSPAIQFNNDVKRPVFSVTGWAGPPGGIPPDQENWPSFFAVFVDQPGRPNSDVPPLTGPYHWVSGTLAFTPRYPLQPGLRYRAVFRPRAEHTPPPELLAREFDIAERHTAPTTFVENVYPTADRLPENQLKFYVHFSAPMSRGEAYRRVHLLDGTGRPIDLAFLEIEQELWDHEGRRLTLLFDPGRVKRDLLPNREVGSPLRDGERYTLVIDRAWPDATGAPLKQEFRKAFQAGPPDHESPDEKRWKITPPKAGTKDSLIIVFPEPMDYALASRVIRITTATGRPVAGIAEVDRGETRWKLQPEEAWEAGNYVIEATTILEDLAGNSLGRPFEVDVFEKVEDRIVQAMRTVRFSVEAEGSRR